jgi:hypothetical protein
MKKVSLAQQLEECQMALKDLYPFIKDRKGVMEFRTERMRGAARTIGWVIENEASIRSYIDQQKRDSLAEKIGV